MACFAKLNNDNVVERVEAVVNEVILDENGQESESLGIAFLQSLYGADTKWKQSSYNTHQNNHFLGGTPFRKNHAAIGYIYDESKDAFHPPRPYASWNLNEETCWWEPPVSEPALTAEELENGSIYKWNEDNVAWELYTPSTE